nr:hypothetical protein [Tanacetum cinerariifolium]
MYMVSIVWACAYTYTARVFSCSWFVYKDEVEHRLFEIYVGKLEVDDKQFDHKDYWTRVGKSTLTNHMELLVKEPLMKIMHNVIVGSLVHREASRKRCQKWDLWMMSALEESVRTNLREGPPLLELHRLPRLEAFGELHHQTFRNLC